jgi:hypothetical protein
VDDHTAFRVVITESAAQRRAHMSRTKLLFRVALGLGVFAAIIAGVYWIPPAYKAYRVYQLTGRLKETTDFPTRVKTIYELGGLGEDASIAVDSLIVILNDDADLHIRSSAAIALGRIGDERASPHIKMWMTQLDNEGKKETSHFKACEWAVAKLKKG